MTDLEKRLEMELEGARDDLAGLMRTMEELREAGRAFEIMRRRKCWVRFRFDETWRVQFLNQLNDNMSVVDEWPTPFDDPVEAILAFDEAERRAGR